MRRGRGSAIPRELARKAGPNYWRTPARSLCGAWGGLCREIVGRPGPGRMAAGDESLAVEKCRDDAPGNDVDCEEREPEHDRERDGWLDDLEGYEGGDPEQGQACERCELLGDSDVAGSGGEGDADPDCPERDERSEEELGEELRGVEGDSADDLGGAEADDDRNDEVDGVGEADRRDEHRGGFSE